MNETMNCQTSKATETVNEAIRTHEEEAEDWAYRGIARRLHGLCGALNERFFHGALPIPVISLGPDLIVRYGYYVIGRDEIGARHRIHLNSRHFGRSESDVAVTLLHEMIHLFQHLFGTPGTRARYHNQQFVDLAARAGIESALGNGVTLSVRPWLREVLERLGFSRDRALIPGLVAQAKTTPLRKVMWRCQCRQELWADRGEAVEAVCRRCGAGFQRPGAAPLVVAERSTGVADSHQKALTESFI